MFPRKELIGYLDTMMDVSAKLSQRLVDNRKNPKRYTELGSGQRSNNYVRSQQGRCDEIA
jgi:hypothetical protein